MTTDSSDKLYRVNDALTALASEMGSKIPDGTLNELTHHVAQSLGIVNSPMEIARHWMSDNIRNVFFAEISNERSGGVSPATLGSTLDSISQAEDIMCEGWEPRDFVGFTYLAFLLGWDTEVRDLL